MRRRSPIAIALAFAATLLAPQAAQAFPSGVDYVALGDSFTAGPLVPNQSDPFWCMRSSNNYASILSRRLSAEGKLSSFTDVSCSGATTVNMTAAQGSNPPQFNALKPTTDLVTITIGGNDIGFTDIVRRCIQLGFERFWNSSPCHDEFTANGVDQLANRVAGAAAKVTGVINGIKLRSPNAQIVVIGYLRGLPSSRPTWCPAVAMGLGDIPYLDSVQQKLNTMIKSTASTTGVKFVDMYAGSTGRDACADPKTKWVEGAIPTSVAFPFHPNANGMSAVENQIRFCDAAASLKQPNSGVSPALLNLLLNSINTLCPGWM